MKEKMGIKICMNMCMKGQRTVLHREWEWSSGRQEPKQEEQASNERRWLCALRKGGEWQEHLQRQMKAFVIRIVISNLSKLAH